MFPSAGDYVPHSLLVLTAVVCGREKKAAGDDHGQVCFVLARSISSPFVRQPAGSVACARFFVGGPLHSPALLFFVRSGPLPRQFTRSRFVPSSATADLF